MQVTPPNRQPKAQTAPVSPVATAQENTEQKERFRELVRRQVSLQRRFQLVGNETNFISLVIALAKDNHGRFMADKRAAMQLRHLGWPVRLIR